MSKTTNEFSPEVREPAVRMVAEQRSEYGSEWEVMKSFAATLDTRPIYHSSDAAIRGHVFCSFLALVLQKELARDCETANIKPEWQPLLRDLDRLQVATLTKDGKSIVVRTPVSGQVGNIFKAAGVALPPNIRDLAAA